MTSFTTEYQTAKTFAMNEGMIIAINNAFPAIFEGKLIAADVLWISIHAEAEFILLPTTLQNLQLIDKTASEDYHYLQYNDEDLNVYESFGYKSVDLKSVIWNTSQRIKPPSLWFGNQSPDYIKAKKKQFEAWIILIGGFIVWECPICRVDSRLCEYSGCLLTSNVECMLFLDYLCDTMFISHNFVM